MKRSFPIREGVILTLEGSSSQAVTGNFGWCIHAGNIVFVQMKVAGILTIEAPDYSVALWGRVEWDEPALHWVRLFHSCVDQVVILVITPRC